MVDFRTRVRFPLDQFIAAHSAQPSGFEGLSKVVQGVERGITRGIELSETLNQIRERKQRSKQLANLIQSGKLQQLDQQFNLPAGTTALVAKERGISGLLPLFTRKPEKTREQQLKEIAEEKRVEMEVAQEFQKAKEERGEKVQERREKRKIQQKLQTATKDINDFLTLDEQIPRGKGIERFTTGLSSLAEGIKQEGSVGKAVAAHQALSKRLRVSLVRAAGDVGNINIVEQEAAEKIIPGIFDSDEVVEVKRTFLKQLSKATENRDPEVMRQLFNAAGVNFTESPTPPTAGQTIDLGGGQSVTVIED